jgi:acyl-[acyl-carrier-protein]-phospholipid O-acyltransferase/long-chain-fatty-acid--[acyl-carrier-protein] ligase
MVDLSTKTSVTASGQHGLWSASFLGLLVTQLLTAMNDNIFRWMVIGIGKQFYPQHMGAVLAFGTACFVVPYIVLAAPSGYLADRFSKRTVVVLCKWTEVLCMTLGVLGVYLQSVELLFAVVVLIGAQSALFAPAKLGCIPEMLRSDCISAANGLMGLTTMVGTVVGMALGNVLVGEAGARGQDMLWLSAPILIGAALLGSLASLSIERLTPADPDRKFPWDALSQMRRDLSVVSSNAALLRIAFGLVFYWSIALLAQLNIDQFAYEGGTERQTQLVPLLLALVAGVAIGNVLAGVWSEGRVELGILPLGAGGMAVAAMLLFTAPDELVRPETTWTAGYIWACSLLLVLGFSAGLFEVPLNAYLQHRSPHEARGSVLAATNMLIYTGMLLVSMLYSGLRLPSQEGSLAHIEVLKKVELTAGEEQRVEQTVQRFETTGLDIHEPAYKTMEPFLEGVQDDARKVLLARLAWTDIHARKEEEKLIRDAYIKPFPKPDEPLVRHVFDEAYGRPLLTSKQIFLLCGVLTIPVFVYIILSIPQAVIRFIVWLSAHTIYRIKVFNRHHLPDEGGALLVANHISWLDGVILLLTSSRPIRMIVYAGNFEQSWLKWMANLWGAILLGSTPKTLVAALREARDALKNGELVCIFPEGGISRSGQIQTFKPGAMKILQGADVPVIPIYLDELWGSIFSFERGRFFWKWPRAIPYPISIHFGPPIPNPTDIYKVRQAVQNLGATAVQARTQRRSHLVRTMIRNCKRRKFVSKVADTTGTDLTGGSMLMRALMLRRLLRRHVLKPGEQCVGVLMPPSVAGAVVNVSLALDKRVAVNLNYTVSSEVMNVCIKQAGITHVLTSKKFMDKMNFQLDAEVVLLEELKDMPTLTDKLVGATLAYATPAFLLDRLLGLTHVNADDPLTIIFTSGSTGEPKGVVLTHGNVGSNVEAINVCVRLTKEDVVIGILPFFHSFGYTVTFWTLCGLDVKAAYHYSPLEPRQIGKLTKEHKGTVLLTTPTFMRGLVRRCEKEELETLNVVVTGAEKLPKDLADAFEAKFGMRPVEGYGCTELSPLASVNIPASRSVDNFQADRKEGTVGRPVPGVAAMVVHLDTGEELGANEPGMLMIKGPNVMQGYLHRDDLTSQVIKDGWYVTGDVAFIDDEGFIHITGRQSRFSKIGGEMVPHIKIEETLNEIAGTADQEHVSLAVSAVPDEKKGERLIVLHTKLEKTPRELIDGLGKAGLPNLFIPGADSFFEVEQLPVLGTGKLDLRALKQLALEKASATSPA